jgi:hypothetical protein
MEASAKIRTEAATQLTPDLAVSANTDRYHELALSLAASAALLVGLCVLAMRWRLPLLGMHSFRQTQTAITSYWLIRGSPWFNYETPVFGAPWSTPFEFPFYQLLVAGLAEWTGLPLDSTGRLLSYLFLVLTIIPVRMLARAWKLDGSYVRVFAILLLASPIYLFWGTAFLIETFVVFFCFWFLAEVELTTRSSHWTPLVLSIFCGAVGALGKITTFVPFALLAGLILLNDLVTRLRRRESLLRPILNGGAIMAISLILFEIWTRFADAEKLKNPIASHLVSTLPAMHRWFFGNWAQLFSTNMLLTLLRALTDTLGVLGVPIVIASVPLAIYYRIVDRRTGIIISAALGAFLLPFIVFTNVHIVHNYYDAANAIFLICGLAILVTQLFSTGHRQAGWNLLALTVASQLLWFGLFFVDDIRNPYDRPLLAISKAINAKTDADAVIVIYGQNSSPVIPYYAQRRALMDPDAEPPFSNEETLERARRMLASQGGHRVEAVVRCKSQMDRFPEFDRIFRDLDTHVSKQQMAGCDVYFVGNGPTH